MRKKLLIKPALQLKHLTLTLGVVLVVFVACYALFEMQIGSALQKGALDQAAWIVLRGHLRFGFACTLVLLLAGIGIEHYFFFHSIAGPLYALEKGLRRLAQGHFHDTTRIRESDQLGELIQAFEDMKKQLLTRMEAQEKTAQLLSQEIDKLLSNASHENIDALRRRLVELRSHVETKAA